MTDPVITNVTVGINFNETLKYSNSYTKSNSIYNESYIFNSSNNKYI
mgnify:CR=1 FL=1|jgi:hypothetical protein